MHFAREQQSYEHLICIVVVWYITFFDTVLIHFVFKACQGLEGLSDGIENLSTTLVSKTRKLQVIACCLQAVHVTLRLHQLGTKTDYKLVNKHLITCPNRGNSEFCFPEILSEFEGKQNSLFPHG